LKKSAASRASLGRRPFFTVRRPARRRARYFLLLTAIASILLSSCSHKVTQEDVAPPPALPQAEHAPAPATTADIAPEKITPPAGGKPIFEETGMASWYGAPYNNRKGSNGEVYNMNAMTAAHLTLPLGSIVRVTNLKTEHSAIVRITDRGPFVTGRIVDLSLAAAKALDIYVPGTAKVRLEVLRSPTPLDSGGRWAVQIGAFKKEKTAAKLVEQLKLRYQKAKVVKFLSPVGVWWVRVRVAEDDRKLANAVAHDTQVEEGTVFLVRLD
jgi:rare lipoprotein A